MERKSIAPRADWQARVEGLGFNWHTPARPYWDETAYWRFTQSEIEVLRNAAREAQEMLIDTIDNIIKTRSLPFYGYDVEVCALIEASWERSAATPNLLGRFTIAYDGVQPKIVSYDGDMPKGLFETSMVQKAWQQEAMPGVGQFNRLHEGLRSSFQTASLLNRARGVLGIHVACLTGDPNDNNPDLLEAGGTAGYLVNAANEIGANATLISLADIGWMSEDEDGEAADYFVDAFNNQIHSLVKVAPLPWMLEGDLGDNLISEATSGNLTLIESPWKALATNKRTLAALWDRYAYHPLLLHTSMNEFDVSSNAYVRKPVNGVGGANITVFDAAKAVEDQTNGDYLNDQFVFQERAPVAAIDSNFATFQIWMSGGDGVALGVRENDSVITDTTARFVPHIVAESSI